MNKIIFLAADLQEGSLITHQEYAHWADAYLASISDGRAQLKRDADGYMRPEEDGRQVYGGGSFDDDETKAKNEAGRALVCHMSNYREDGRYGDIRIVVDAAGYLVCGDDENSLMDAATYGRAAGYKLRSADAARIGQGNSDE